MRVLVTGGAGYIGSHTCKALAHAGHEPITLDNLSTGHRWAVQWGPLVEGDLCEHDRLPGMLSEWRIEAIIHLAAHGYVGESVENPRKYYRNNLVNTLGLLEAALDAGVSHVVFSSTCAVYGVPDEGLPLREEHPLRPINPYGDTKLAVERALRWYGNAYGFGWAALRYFNAAGADPAGDLGEDHCPETHLMPRVIETAMAEHLHLDIYGHDFDTPDGTAIRDYIHVADLARAHVHALEYLASGGESMALNLGTGTGHSVRQVIRAVEDLSQREVRIHVCKRRTGDPAVLIADSTLARSILDWKPELSDLETMTRTAWDWHESRYEEREPLFA